MKTSEGVRTVGWIVLPGTVIVKVASAPRALAGIALPTPALVKGVGNAKVDVFGTSPDSYMSPMVPFRSVYCPVSKFAIEPSVAV